MSEQIAVNEYPNRPLLCPWCRVELKGSGINWKCQTDGYIWQCQHGNLHKGGEICTLERCTGVARTYGPERKVASQSTPAPELPKDFERGYVIGQATTYAEQVLTGTKSVAELGCRDEFVTEVVDTIKSQGCLCRVSQWDNGRSTVLIYKNPVVVRFVDLLAAVKQPIASLAMGKLFGYSDEEVIKYCSEIAGPAPTNMARRDKTDEYDARHDAPSGKQASAIMGEQCVFCGATRPNPMPANWNSVCTAPSNVTEPDTVGNRHHVFRDLEAESRTVREMMRSGDTDGLVAYANQGNREKARKAVTRFSSAVTPKQEEGRESAREWIKKLAEFYGHYDGDSFVIDSGEAFPDILESYAGHVTASLRAERDERPTKLAYDCVKDTCDSIAEIVGYKPTGDADGDQLVRKVAQVRQALEKIEYRLREWVNFSPKAHVSGNISEALEIARAALAGKDGKNG